MIEVLSKAGFLVLRTLLMHTCEGQLGALLQLRCRLGPSLQFPVAPLRQVVHVLKQLGPGHHARSRVWRYEVRASALGMGADLLAHVHANTSKLVLKLRTVLQVSCHACRIGARRLSDNPCGRQRRRGSDEKDRNYDSLHFSNFNIESL